MSINTQFNLGMEESLMYRGFILRKCNDGISYDILHKNYDNNGEHLIAIVGSYEKAKQWVDEWYRKYR